jgi:hypothetical protein
MMVCCSELDCYFGHCPSYWLFVKNTVFQRLDLSLSSGEGRREGCLLWWVPCTELVSSTGPMMETSSVVAAAVHLFAVSPWAHGLATWCQQTGSSKNYRLCPRASLGYGLAHFRWKHLLQWDSYWLRWMHLRHLFQQPRHLQTPAASRLLYTDTTPTSIGILDKGPPRQTLTRFYEDAKPIAFAELAAAPVALVQAARRYTAPTTLTIATNSSVVYETHTSQYLQERRVPAEEGVRSCVITPPETSTWSMGRT